MIHYIYITTNNKNGKRYIGKRSASSIELDKYFGSGKLLKRAINKYGPTSFKKEILEICEKSMLNAREIFYIDMYNAVLDDSFYNIASGGDGGHMGPIVNETRRKALMGHIISEETKRKISKAKTGKRLTSEQKSKHANALNASSAFRNNVERLNKNQKGGNNSRAKAIGQFDLNENLIKEWKYAKLASIELGISYSCISQVATGKQKTAGGFNWKYIKKENNNK